MQYQSNFLVFFFLIFVCEGPVWNGTCRCSKIALLVSKVLPAPCRQGGGGRLCVPCMQSAMQLALPHGACAGHVISGEKFIVL